jgi:ferrous iron transport protein A
MLRLSLNINYREVREMMPLGLLGSGEKAQVMEIQGGTHGCQRCKCLCRLEDMGLRCGKTVEMLSNPGHGSLVVRVDDSRLALGRGLAMKVGVRRIDA